MLRALGEDSGMRDTDGVPECLLTAREAARILGVTPKRLYELGIPAVRISERSLRWRPSTLSAWITQREGSSAA
jgi:predicted DNA-binding transcriptional regulator AlpA